MHCSATLRCNRRRGALTFAAPLVTAGGTPQHSGHPARRTAPHPDHDRLVPVGLALRRSARLLTVGRTGFSIAMYAVGACSKAFSSTCPLRPCPGGPVPAVGTNAPFRDSPPQSGAVYFRPVPPHRPFPHGAPPPFEIEQRRTFQQRRVLPPTILTQS